MNLVSKSQIQRPARRFTLGVLLISAALTSLLVNTSLAQDISQTEIHDSVEKIATAINDHYFDAKLASQIQKDLQSSLSNNKYDDIRTRRELADRITAQLMAMTKDKHLVVSPRQLKQKVEGDAERSAVDEEKAAVERTKRRAMVGKRSNFGIQRFELLSGNIAYLNFTSFYRPNEVSEILAAQMKLAANADAVILDMRRNMGGSTGTVSLLSSYFFEGPKRKLFEVINRSGDAQTYSTDPTVQNRNETRPVFVLVHPTTFSAGEGLAFLLQDQKRAIVIGETTAGAANPGRPYYANEWFEVNVPNGFIKAAISGKNWEGTGVTPDINSKGADALLIARRIAIKEMIQKEEDETYRAQLQTWLDELN